MSRDLNWLEQCNAIAKNSKCMSRKVGSIIVKDSKFIISTGYNGPCIGSKHCSDSDYRDRIKNLVNKDTNSRMVWYLDSPNICIRRALEFKSSQGLEYCQAAHSERNAIDIAARLGHSTEGHTMYMNCGIPCMECAKSIVNSGIKEIVVIDKNDIYEKKGITGLDILNFGGVKIREYEKE